MEMKNLKAESHGLQSFPVLLSAGAAISLALSPAVAEVANVECASEPATNQPAWLNPPQPLQLTLGAFDFHPHLRALTVYDDNIEFLAKGKQADIINQISPGVQIVGGDRSTLRTYFDQYADQGYVSDLAALSTSSLVIHSPEIWPDKFLVVDYSTQWQLFGHYTRNDSVDQFVTVNAEWPMAKWVTGFLEDYSDQKIVLAAAATRTEVRQNQTELNAGYQFDDKYSVDTAFGFQDVAYPESPNLDGYTEGRWGLSLNRQIAQIFYASLVGASGFDQVIGGQNQQFNDFGGRIRYRYSEKFSMDASLGEEYRQYDSGIPSTLKPYGTLGVTYAPWERTYLRLMFTRQQFPSLYDGDYYVSTGGELVVRKYFTDRFLIQSDIGYYQADFMPTTETGGSRKPLDYYAVRIDGEVRLFKDLDAEVYYLFRGSGISQNDNVLQENQCGFQVLFQF
jgi:hypothetical protein